MSKLKIGGDVSGVKKSILDLGKDLKSLGKTKISIFNERDRKFLKNELGRELKEMKTKLIENRAEVGKLIKEQSKLEKGSQAELAQRKKILATYQQQTKLAQEMDRAKRQRSDLGRFGGAGGSTGGTSGLSGILGKIGSMVGGAALGVGGLALIKGYQAAQQYSGGARNRVRLKGLGVQGENFGSAEDLASAGLTEQDMIRRRISATARLGRTGGSQESVLQQAKFERAYGLEEGAMMNTSGALRGQFGGTGADQAQMKLQASVMAAGIEDAVGPYLEAATDLLKDINKNGMTNTDEMVRMFATLTKTGERTPEQIAEAFKGIDQAVKGSSGEANAFFQTAFARGGIGGGTVGATRMAMQSGGIFGLNEDELSRRGYNPELLKNMKGAGFMSGAGERTGAILDQFKSSAGLGKDQSIGGISDLNTMVGLSQMANSTLGTEGMGGFDALKMMEQVKNKQMSQKQFETKLQEMKDKKDPTVDRLNKINESLAGQTTILRDINSNLMESLGKKAVKVANIGVEGENALVQGTGNVAGAVDDTGILDRGMSAAKSFRSNMVGGGLGEKLYDAIHGNAEDLGAKMVQDSKSRAASNEGVQAKGAADVMAEAVERGMTKAMSAQKRQETINKNNVNVKVQTGDGRIVNKTHR